MLGKSFQGAAPVSVEVEINRMDDGYAVVFTMAGAGAGEGVVVADLDFALATSASS
jgi:hypothetical protein